MILVGRNDCIQCPPDPPQCPGPCDASETCAVTSQVCGACPQIQCFPRSQSSVQKSGGTSKAALAGAVVGALVILAAILGLIFYLQKRRKAQKVAMEKKALEPPTEVPASAADVLRREDPHEKTPGVSSSNNTTRVYDAQSLTTINLDPNTMQGQSARPSVGRTESQPSQRNPFGDQSTLGSHRTDESQQGEVPIAMVPYGSVSAPTPTSPKSPNSPVSATPSRPARSADVSLRLDGSSSPFDLSHVNVSDDDSFAKPGVPASVRSNMTSGSRASYLTTGTYATDLYNPESSTVVMRQQGRIVGLSKAQVVAVPNSSGNSPVASSHLMPVNHRLSRATIAKSPLAQSSFISEDIPEESGGTSPFADSHAAAHSLSPALASGHDARSVRTTASNSAGWNDADSVASGIEASISSAKRVFIRSDGRLTSPSMEGHSQYSHSQYSGASSHRLSFVSEASSRADSILEAFPFVPPSLPPSPMSTQTFRSTQTGFQRSPQPRSPLSAFHSVGTDDEELVPPGRRGQPVSVYSAKSTASSGLGDYPVELQIDSASAGGRSPLPSRASLDTLALSRDLSAFPLAFDEAKTPTRDTFQGSSKDNN